MRVKYYKEDDLLVIKLSNKPFAFAEMESNFVVHYTKDNEPVLIEILNANQFLKATNRALPSKVRQQIFASS